MGRPKNRKTKPTLGALLATAGVPQSDLARVLRVSRQAVSKWCADGVPIGRVPSVSNALGVSMLRVRPDFFGR
jgi:DNA-binding transcriptional regulator YdaS (Cro superfamily)